VLSILNQAEMADLFWVFAVGVGVGFLYKLGDIYALSKVENAIGVPSGVLA
jgi:hypothetical protein